MTIQELEQEVNKIKERNKKVEADKAWESSLFRKILVAVLTYIVISTFFLYAGFPNPFESAIVPTLGFILSTISIPIVKEFWIKNIYKK